MNVYKVTIGGVEHTMQLSDEDAKRMDAKPVDTKGGTASNKAGAAKNKSA